MKVERFAFLFVGAALLLLAYVWLQVTLISCGYKVEALKESETQLLDQHRVLQYNVLILRSPVILSKRLGESQIQLKPPRAVETLPGRGVLHPLLPLIPAVSPQGVAPTFLARASSTLIRWLGGARQAEAEPAP